MTLTATTSQDAATGIMTAVPLPREVLTSIVNTLSAFDPAQSPQTARQTTTGATNRNAASTTATASPGNPLRLIPNSHRALLTTLHVLYPTTLLPALDLLDRRLVTRVKVASPAQCSDNDETNESHPPETQPDNETTPTAKPPPQLPAETPLNPPQTRRFHLVRSAQPQSTHHRRKRDNQASATSTSDNATSFSGGGGVGGKLYVVRLDAWNCSCAAFAFSAFPPEQRILSQPARHDTHDRQQQQQQQDLGTGDGAEGVNTSFLTRLRGEPREAGSGAAAGVDGEKGVRECAYDILPAAGRNDRENARQEFRRGGRAGIIDHDAAWEFGGLSMDGLQGSGISGVPCCKHLLACLLGERWSSVLGSTIEERIVSREEAAGLMSDT